MRIVREPVVHVVPDAIVGAGVVPRPAPAMVLAALTIIAPEPGTDLVAGALEEPAIVVILP